MGNYADRVCETTNTTGTGTLTLEGAVDGYQSFVAGIGNGNTCKYCITDGYAWEVGEGTVTDASSDTLSRDTIEASSNSGSAVNWGSGEKTVFHVFSATDFDRPEITDLTLSGGLYLGGTGAANYLDDYEEGTWTPVLEGDTTAGSHTYTSQDGYYVKTGKSVYIECNVVIDSFDAGAAGNTFITGLPFAGTASRTGISPSSVMKTSNTYPADFTGFVGRVWNNDVQIGWSKDGDENQATLDISNLGDGATLRFSATYRTA